MKLDRNVGPQGFGKYAVVNLRKAKALPDEQREAMAMALVTLEHVGVLEWGRVGEEDEFFVIKLKDRNAEAALNAYAANAAIRDAEYAQEVFGMAKRAGQGNPFCKDPD